MLRSCGIALCSRRRFLKMSMSTRLSFVLTSLLLLVLSAAAVQAQEVACRACAIAQESCAVNCFGRDDKKEMKACLIGCDNAAAVCSCDEPATLNSEDYVARFGFLEAVTDSKAACHSTTPCDSSYGACANWSSYTNCGDPFCGPTLGCGVCDEWGQCTAGGPGMKQFRERYRVCFNEFGQSCTEWQRTTSSGGCGC
jgi:hypothetical protein